MHEQLQATVETLRAKDFAELDAGLVEDLLAIERDCLDLRSGVLVRLEQVVDKFLLETGAS